MKKHGLTCLVVLALCAVLFALIMVARWTVKTARPEPPNPTLGSVWLGVDPRAPVAVSILTVAGMSGETVWCDAVYADETGKSCAFEITYQKSDFRFLKPVKRYE